ncbi:MAG: hypothetical protein E7495_09790 [Ruminococcus flavefaciens]|nr:hypothetical protein [Ruminococcus flavefaciens]
MKKLIAAIMSICIVGGSLPAVYSGAPECVITANAEDYKEVVDGVLTYNVYADHAEVIGFNDGVEGEIIIPSEINGVPVTIIGWGVFRYSSTLTSITIPDTVTTIGDEAFCCCSSLESITIPDSVTDIGSIAFSDCSSLTSITIGNSVTSIGDEAFHQCSSLESISIPDSVTSIGYKAFSNCSSLELIEVSENNYFYTSIDGVLFDKAKKSLILYPEGREAHEYTIPDTVTCIDNGAFQDCSRLESITIPDSVTYIGIDAFIYCSNLMSITIPDSVTTIDNRAFGYCSSLESITISDSVTTIAYDAFYKCLSLMLIKVSENNNYFTSIDGVLFNKDITNLILYPADREAQEYIIPDTVTNIDSEAFWGCKNLKSLTLPSSVRYTDFDCFSNCSSLEEITILNPKCKIDYFATMICNGYDEEKSSYYYNGVIRGYDDSTAQYYAEFFGRNFESLGEAPTDEPTTGKELKKGDANGDGGVDMSDVVMVMQAYLNPAKYGVDGTSEDRITADGEKAGDVDGKAGLTANDALIIQRYSLKLIDNF